ncbi:MAG: cytochrome c biogenesis protein CcdA [Clostridia bacterium]|nr:cytochrome c biogenesis protein CcdA [Clostridia bacterium]
MEYVFTFLEGIASFISPCLLPMLPIYISYFMGEEEENNKKAIINSIGFVLGFTIVFLILSIFASTFGILISKYLKYIKIVFGIIIILLGLNYMELLQFKFLNRNKGVKFNTKNLNFFKAMLFGILFSISWTPCIGSFLGSALLIVAKGQNLIKGIILMLLYSIGLGIPFVISVVLMEKLKNIFSVIKNNYKIIKKVSGIILIFMGLYVMF